MEHSVEDRKGVVRLNSPKENGWKLREVVDNERREYPFWELWKFHIHGAIFATVPTRGERMLGV
jgi:hypothetical protein